MNDAIRLENVFKALSGREVLKKVSFAVQPGDIFGYLGPNGAGKTTSIRIMLGLFKPTAGKVSIMGMDTNTDFARKKNRLRA